MQFALLVLRIALIATFACAARDSAMLNDDVSVQFLGHSGKMRLWRKSDPKTHVEIGWDKIEEYDDGGRIPSASVNFASQNFDWSDPETVAVDDSHNATKVTMTVNIGGGSTQARLDVFLYEEDTIVTHANTTFIVRRDHAKFSVGLRNWPWRGPQNTLSLGCWVKYKAAGDPEENDDEGEASDRFHLLSSSTTTTARHKMTVVQSSLDRPGHRGLTVHVGRVEVHAIDRAIVDGQPVDISVTPYSQGAFNGILLHFPHFQDSVEYDPSFGLIDSDQVPEPSQENYYYAAVGFAIAVVAMLLVAGVCCCCRRCRKHRDASANNNPHQKLNDAPV